MYGAGWIEQTWKWIQEDKNYHYNMLINIAPLSRTPMDKDGGKSLNKYAKTLRNLVDQLTPWKKPAGGLGLREKLRGKVKPGEIVILLDEGESSINNPLFEGVKQVRK